MPSSHAPPAPNNRVDPSSDPQEPMVTSFPNLQGVDPPTQLPAQVPLGAVQGSRPQYTNAGATQNMSGACPAGPSKVSYFENTSNFVVHNPIMGENIRIIHNHTSTNVLEKMLPYVIPGAVYDSDARDSPPRCHPGTRTQILEDVQSRAHAMETRLVWISGPVGVGKSAIMQTLAEAEASRNGIFTTLFFSRPNERDDPKKAFPTLAYGLAVLNSEYRCYIGERLARDPTFLAKSIDEQFQRLFVTPFAENHINFGSQRWIIFLDGLDECRGEREQGRIVDLICNSMLHRAMSTPLTWVIASRPEAHLKVHFARAKTDVKGFWELEVPVDSNQSSRDVEHYLHGKFSEIREQRPDSIPHLWPPESDFLTLSRASTGLFVFASTLVTYLLGGNPVARLKHVVTLIKKSKDQTNNLSQNPFSMLDLLYTQIMSDVPPEDLPVTIHILGFYLVEAALRLSGRPCPLLRASNILGLEQYVTYAALRKLPSVLACPAPHEARNQPIKFLHTSFSDFLSDSSRSGGYHIDLSQGVTHLWQCYNRILRQHKINRPCSGITLYWPPAYDQLLTQALLLACAQQQWVKIIVQFWTPDDSNGIRLLIDQSALVDIFRELGLALFLGAKDIVYPPDILAWLDHKAPYEPRQCFVVETFPVKDLDLDRLFKSLCAQHWCWCWSESLNGLHFNTMDLSSIEGFTVAQWAQAKEVLWTPSSELGELVPALGGTVRVVALEPAERCVVIGPLPSDNWLRTYYVLPYVGFMPF